MSILSENLILTTSSCNLNQATQGVANVLGLPLIYPFFMEPKVMDDKQRTCLFR